MRKNKEGKPLANCDPENKAKTSSISYGLLWNRFVLRGKRKRIAALDDRK